VVNAALRVGRLYLPPLLVGLVTLAVAGLVATRRRWAPAVGAAFAAVLLIGTFGIGLASGTVSGDLSPDYRSLGGRGSRLRTGISPSDT
jgi:hypothetical protein